MKVSEITVPYVAEFLKLEEDEYEPTQMQMILDAAVEYVADYTHIPKYEEGIEGKTLDDYAKFPIAVLVLCQDMHDNRSFTVGKSYTNQTVSSILNMHSANYV
ncbi:MAG: phage gp6-like head-tail connector protein [Lachnospiraceae bacterium]|nr:phage gp6-like head-tail connector protein [Lachnospiraceae bacterium]